MELWLHEREHAINSPCGLVEECEASRTERCRLSGLAGEACEARRLCGATGVEPFGGELGMPPLACAHPLLKRQRGGRRVC